MTVFITFDALKNKSLRFDQKLPVSRVAQSRSPSRLGLRRGQTITVENAINALVTKSANDVATVIAEAIGGTERKFAKIMTKRARALGMKNTTFKNASGLPNRRQLSTAEDMAILARALLYMHGDLYHYFSRQTFTFEGRRHRSHNKLMSRYKGMDGIKTGYTRASGFNLVASAQRSGVRVIAVVFGGKTSQSRDRHTARLLNRGFTALDAGVVSAKTTKALASTNRHPKRKQTLTRGTFQKSNHRAKNRAATIHRPSRTLRSGYFRGWAIQVGAYTRYAPARRAVTRAAKAVPSLIGKKVQIVRQRSKMHHGLKIYKARLLVRTKSKARNSCRALKRRKIDCMVVQVKLSS